jgi:transcriptional regulator with XRE-family HTH domain
MTQAEFADLLGIARKTLIRYELNEREPDVDFIVKLNLLYHVQPLWLLTGVAEATSVKLTANAAQLLTDYERCTSEDQAVIRRTAAALAGGAQSGKTKGKKHG